MEKINTIVNPDEIINFLLKNQLYTIEQLEHLLTPNWYVIIPTEILENKEIPPNAKILYGEIMALTKKRGHCFATNKYIASRLGLSTTSVPSLLRKLKDFGLISIKIQKSKKGTYRKIIVLWGSLNNEEGHSCLTRGGIAKQRYQSRYYK